MKGNEPFSNNNRKNDAHPNIEFSRSSAQTNGTNHTNSTYLNENYEATNQTIDGINSVSCHKRSNRKGYLMHNGDLSKNRSGEEKNFIEKSSNVNINSNNIEKRKSVIPQVVINDGEEEDEVFENKTLTCMKKKGQYICINFDIRSLF